MKKRVINALLVGMLTTFILQQSVLEMPSMAAAMEPGSLVCMGEDAECIPGESAREETEQDGEAVQGEQGQGGESAREETEQDGEAVQGEQGQGGESAREETEQDGEAVQGEQGQGGESAREETEQDGEAVQGKPKQKEDASADTEGHEGFISGSGPETGGGTDAAGAASQPGGEPETASEDNGASESAAENTEDGQEESEYANLAIAQVDNYVNLRQEPNTDSEILGKIYNGAVAQIQAVAGEEQDWFRVISGSVEGYIKSEYFIYGDEAVEAVDDYVTRYAAVTVDRLNVRQEPDADSKRIGYVGNGEKLELLEQQGDWLLVQYTEDQTGYVAAEYVTVSEEFLYAKSIEEERAEQEARRMAAQEQLAQDQIAQGQITQDQIAQGQITQDQIVQGQITQDQLAQGQITQDQIAQGQIAQDQLAQGQIAQDQIAQGQMTQDQIVQGQTVQDQSTLVQTTPEQAVPESPVETPLTPPAVVYTSNEELRSAIVDYAMLYLGYPYVHGGRSLAGGTDCSGFTCYIYADFGYSISRTPSGQYSSAGRSIDYSEIQPGDIICYGKTKCTHVGMYIGDGQIIHAANSRKGVVIYDAGYDTILDVRNVID
ncbi:MAG: SH3 domain-containing protein [Lachnospiraceae bacterium]|nr:SH3 domain-containing protein [Lachnospiraceae bacterium]